MGAPRRRAGGGAARVQRGRIIVVEVMVGRLDARGWQRYRRRLER
jgi:hypothetical protein